MNQQDQIDKLNSRVKYRIGPSPIQGVGIFALRDIPKGTRLHADEFPQPYSVPYSSFGQLFPEVKQLLLERWPQIVNGSRFCYPDTFLQAYMNHGGDESNYDAVNDIATKDIPKDAEILEDYRLIPGYEQVFPWLVDK